MHHSQPYVISAIRRIKSLRRLDAFGLALANDNHFWTNRERKEFNKRVRELS